MSGGGTDGFDWLRSFLPADGQPDHDPNPNNEAYQTHPAFHDAEEVARAAVMHQQARNSYSFMRSTNPGTNHASSPSQVSLQVSGVSGGRYGGNKHQQTNNTQFNNPPSGHSVYSADRSHNINQQPNPPVPSQQHLDAQPPEGMDPASYQWRTSNPTPNYSDAYQNTQRVYETARPTVPAHRTNQPMARAVTTSQSSYQGYSATPNQNSHMSTQPYVEQGMTTQVQRTRMPAASQSNSYSHSTIPSHNAERPPHSTTAQGIQPTPPVERTHTPIANPETLQSPYQSPYQSQSTTSAQNTQQQSLSAAAQRPCPRPPVQGKHTPLARAQALQSPYQNHSTVPAQNVQRSSHTNAPPRSHSLIDSESYTPLVSPKGSQTSAVRNTLEPRQSTTPAKITQKASNSQAQNPGTNSTTPNQIPPGPSSHNQDHVQSTVPTAPHRVHSPATSQPATSQPVSTRSPSISLVTSAPTSASGSTPLAPPTQTTIVPHHLDKGWTQEKEGTLGSAAPTSSHQSPNQASQQPPISRPNEQSTPMAPSAYASPAPPAASHVGPSYKASHTSGPQRGTFSGSAVAQQPAAGNMQTRVYPLPGPNHHQKRWVPTEENSMPLAKMRRLDNGQSQTVTLKNNQSASSVPEAQVSTEYARPRGSGKFLKNRDDLVQPIRRSDALAKVSYDPATIARDVLIAAAKHPTEKHLNHHLEPLRRNFTKIDYFANLATFRWDLVDVKQPETQVDRVPPVPAPHMTPLQPPHSQPPQVARHPVARDPAVIPNNVITRDHTSMPSRDTPPNRQIAVLERIDARAPPGGLSSWGTLPFKPPTYHSPQRIFSSSNLPSGLPRIDPVPASPKFSPHRSVPLPTPPPQQQPRPQQRCPSTTNTPAPPKPPPATKQPTPKSTAKPKPQSQTVKSQSDSGRAVKSPEARRLPQPQVVIPISPDKMTTKRRPGRPSKNASNNIEIAIHREQPVHYQIFACKWEGCAAELHNIESVRAHLIKVHIPHSLVCKWQDCGNKTPMAAADMFTHLSSEHVSKLAWELGDGPAVPVTGENDN